MRVLISHYKSNFSKNDSDTFLPLFLQTKST